MPISLIPKPVMKLPNVWRARRAMGMALDMPVPQMPVRTLDTSRGFLSWASSSSLKCVSNPWIIVAFSLTMRSTHASASKVSVSTWRAPLIIDMSAPQMKPKAWKSGRYMRITSSTVTPMRSPMSDVLRTMRWSCTAPLGKPVVPDV